MAGKLIVGQAGGATAVINRSLAGIVREAQEHAGFDAIWGMRYGVEGALRGDFIDLTHVSGTMLATIQATPGAALGSSRYRLSETDVERLLDLFRRNDVRAFLYIGGNDSADTAHRLAQHAAQRAQETRIIAVPKTIDNDLPLTDHCPGYGSIARFTAIATMDSAKDTESMPGMYPIKLIEVMGRDAGWVAAAASLGKGSPEDAPHLIYLPERPVSPKRLLQDVAAVHRDLGRAVIVVTETMRDQDGKPFADPSLSGEVDAFGHRLLRGTADSICRLIQNELGLRSRFDKPGSLQRMSMLCASSTDLEEATEVGRQAVRQALAGLTDCMITIVRDADDPYTWHTDIAPLEAIANRQRLMPDEFLSEGGADITEAFRRYARPLLGAGPLPRYARLDAPAVSIP